VYFKIKLNNKSDAAAVKASRLLIAYLLDNYQKRKPLHRVVALLDMSDVGLTNVVRITQISWSCVILIFLNLFLVYSTAIWHVGVFLIFRKPIMCNESSLYS